jgi:hypothetical protein
MPQATFVLGDYRHAQQQRQRRQEVEQAAAHARILTVVRE